jgi:hypothetical protein
LILKKITEIEHLSDLGKSNAWNAWGGPQLLSNITVGVQPVSSPVGIYFALRYLYDDNSLPPIEKNQTPEMEIKPKEFHHHKQEVSKVLLRPKNWNANPGKNENRQKYRYH